MIIRTLRDAKGFVKSVRAYTKLDPSHEGSHILQYFAISGNVTTKYIIRITAEDEWLLDGNRKIENPARFVLENKKQFNGVLRNQ